MTRWWIAGGLALMFGTAGFGSCSGGGGGTGATGTPGPDPSPTGGPSSPSDRIAACQHVDACGYAFDDTQGNPVSEADCEAACPGFLTASEAACSETAACTQAGINACFPATGTTSTGTGSPGSCNWVTGCLAVTTTAGFGENCPGGQGTNWFVTNNCGEDLVCSLGAQYQVPPPLGTPEPSGSEIVTVASGAQTGENLCSGLEITYQCAPVADRDACFGVPDAGPPACGTCFGPVNPSCPSDAPYADCNDADEACVATPVCCWQACSCNNTCSTGSAAEPPPRPRPHGAAHRVTRSVERLP